MHCDSLQKKKIFFVQQNVINFLHEPGFWVDFFLRWRAIVFFFFLVYSQIPPPTRTCRKGILTKKILPALRAGSPFPLLGDLPDNNTCPGGGVYCKMCLYLFTLGKPKDGLIRLGLFLNSKQHRKFFTSKILVQYFPLNS